AREPVDPRGRCSQARLAPQRELAEWYRSYLQRAPGPDKSQSLVSLSMASQSISSSAWIGWNIDSISASRLADTAACCACSCASPERLRHRDCRAWLR